MILFFYTYFNKMVLNCCSIHPRDKQDVADRLLLSALTVAYNKGAGKYQGPFPTKYFLDSTGKTFLITYDEDSTEIYVTNTDGFEVRKNRRP